MTIHTHTHICTLYIKCLLSTQYYFFLVLSTQSMPSAATSMMSISKSDAWLFFYKWFLLLLLLLLLFFVSRSTLCTWGITFCNAWLILLVFLNKRRGHQNQTTEATAVIKINTHIHVFLFPSSLFGFSSHGFEHTFCRVYFCEKKK